MHLRVYKNAGTSLLQRAIPRVRPSRSAPCSASVAVPPASAKVSLNSPVRSARSASGTPYAWPPCTLWPMLPPDRPAHQGPPQPAARPPKAGHLCVTLKVVGTTLKPAASLCRHSSRTVLPAALLLCMHRHSVQPATPNQKGVKRAEAVCRKPMLCDMGSTVPSVHRPPRWEQQWNYEQVGISGSTVLAADSGRCSSGRRQGCLWALPSTDRCIRLGCCATQQRMHSLACARRPASLWRALRQKRTSVQLHSHAGTCSPASVL